MTTNENDNAMNRRSFLKVAASAPIVGSIVGMPVIAVATDVVRPDFRGLQFHVMQDEFDERDNDVYFMGYFEEKVPNDEIVVRDGRFVWSKEPEADIRASVEHMPADGENVYGESAWLALNPDGVEKCDGGIRRTRYFHGKGPFIDSCYEGYVDLVDCFRPGMIVGEEGES